NVNISQSLENDNLPMPIVTWRAGETSLKISAFGFGGQDQPYGLARYDVTNHSSLPQRITLSLNLVPFQANPPTQFLNRHGGVASVETIAFANQITRINGASRLFHFNAPGRITTRSFGGLHSLGTQIQDQEKLASSRYDYEMILAPNQTKSVILAFAMAENTPNNAAIEASLARVTNPISYANALVRETRNFWSRELSKTRLTMPSGTPPIAQTLRLSQAYQLLLLDNALLKPGARSYDRSWIRDGAMMGEGLMRTGHFDIALNYFKTYSPFIFPSGKVPCCVDARGSDPVAENDSHGEYMWLYAELLRYGWNHEEARTYWPQIRHVFEYQQSIIAPQRTWASAAFNQP
ncbi:MAG: coagulation factor 5/8 type domain-containing protein, partial [Hyphomonadaceae bacterium]